MKEKIRRFWNWLFGASERHQLRMKEMAEMITVKDKDGNPIEVNRNHIITYKDPSLPHPTFVFKSDESKGTNGITAE